MPEQNAATPEPFFVAKEPRKFSINRVFDLFKKKEEKPKVRWMAFSRKIADALTGKQEREISKKIDAYLDHGDQTSVRKLDLKSGEIKQLIWLNNLFSRIIFPAVPAWVFLDALATGNDEVFVWTMGAITAVMAFLNFLETIKTNEYLGALREKMIDLGMEEVVVFVDEYTNRYGGKIHGL